MSIGVESRMPRQLAEDKHWWFCSRTRALLNMLDGCVNLRGGPRRILDVGCGAGNMFHHLARYGSVVGVENNPKPLKVALERGYDVRLAAAESMPFAPESFDLIAALDVIEHCADDVVVLREIQRIAAPGALLVITTPAFAWLWSHNDEINHHYRRYSGALLRTRLELAGFRVRRLAYNNFFIFPLVAALIFDRRKGKAVPDLAAPDTDEEAYQVEMEPASPLVNAALTVVGWVEATLLRWVNLPFGTAIICVAERL